MPPTNVLFCAPTNSAVQTLGKDGITSRDTLQQLLQNPSLQKSIKGGVIVLDEAGLVGSGNMHDLFALAVAHNARVILSGDTAQHKSVPRGDALRILEQYSDYKYLQIQTIRRQHEQFYRNAVREAARHDPQKALDILDHKDWVYESKTYQQDAAEAYVEILKAAQDAKARSDSKHGTPQEKKPLVGEVAPAIMSAPTWGEIDAVTEKVRHCLSNNGILSGDDTLIDTFRSKGWTQAQKRCVANYSVGEQISFQKPVSGFRTNELVTVVGTVDDPASPRKRLLLQVLRANRSKCLFDPRGGGGFDVGTVDKRPFCSGDMILIQVNRKQKRPKQARRDKEKKQTSRDFINGETAYIDKIVNGQIILTDGRTLPTDFRHFAHGYCLTSHTAQGKTAETAIVVANGSSRMVNREQFYVSISRGRSECRVFTNNKADLRQRILKTSERKAGIELIQQLSIEQAQAILKRRSQPLSKISPAALPTTPPLISLPQPPVPPEDLTASIDL